MTAEENSPYPIVQGRARNFAAASAGKLVEGKA